MAELLLLHLTSADQFLLSQLLSPTSRRHTIGNVHNNEARARNHCCHRKTISITHSECVSVAVVTQHVMRMYHIFVCGFFGPAVFFRTFSQKARLSAKSC
jgi:hypothetical protein